MLLKSPTMTQTALECWRIIIDIINYVRYGDVVDGVRRVIDNTEDIMCDMDRGTVVTESAVIRRLLKSER